MPRKAKETTPRPTEEEVYAAGAKLAELPKPEEMFIVTDLCGHINKHFVNIDGVLENLYCVLPKDHGGDHEADYDCLRPVDGSISQARLISAGKEVLTVAGKNYLELTERAYWSDGANTLAADIQPDLAQLAYIKANKGEMLDAEQLVRKA